MNQNYTTVTLCTIVESRIVDYWCRCLHFHSANKSRVVSTLNVVSFTDFRNSVILGTDYYYYYYYYYFSSCSKMALYH